MMKIADAPGDLISSSIFLIWSARFRHSGFFGSRAAAAPRRLKVFSSRDSRSSASQLPVTRKKSSLRQPKSHHFVSTQKMSVEEIKIPEGVLFSPARQAHSQRNGSQRPSADLYELKCIENVTSGAEIFNQQEQAMKTQITIKQRIRDGHHQTRLGWRRDAQTA